MISPLPRNFVLQEIFLQEIIGIEIEVGDVQSSVPLNIPIKDVRTMLRLYVHRKEKRKKYFKKRNKARTLVRALTFLISFPSQKNQKSQAVIYLSWVELICHESLSLSHSFIPLSISSLQTCLCTVCHLYCHKFHSAASIKN